MSTSTDEAKGLQTAYSYGRLLWWVATVAEVAVAALLYCLGRALDMF